MPRQLFANIENTSRASLVEDLNFAETINVSGLRRGPFLVVVQDKSGYEIKFRYVKE